VFDRDKEQGPETKKIELDMIQSADGIDCILSHSEQSDQRGEEDEA